MAEGANTRGARVERRGQAAPPTRRRRPAAPGATRAKEKEGPSADEASPEQPGRSSEAPSREASSSSAAPRQRGLREVAARPLAPPDAPTFAPWEEQYVIPVVPTHGGLGEPTLPGADEPFVSLTTRVRASVDARLGILVNELGTLGVRTTKAELAELALAALPMHPTTELLQGLTAFRQTAPRRP